MAQFQGSAGRTSTCMTTTQTHAAESNPRSDFYVPGAAALSDRAGRIEQYLTSVYRVHRFRGGVTARPE